MDEKEFYKRLNEAPPVCRFLFLQCVNCKRDPDLCNGHTDYRGICVNF